MSRLSAIFKPETQTDRIREKFLSRVFGIFSEQIVAIWTKDERSPYENLGRPTIKTSEGVRHILDFTLKQRASGNIYVSEMKCEIEYENFKYFVLKGVSQLTHHRKPAFEALLRAARPAADQTIFVRSESIHTVGAILIWGAVSPEGRADVIEAKGFHDVLSIEEICVDLVSWKSTQYMALIDQRQKWCNELFIGLLEDRAS